MAANKQYGAYDSAWWIYKDGCIYGAIIQGDLSYAGVLSQLIKENINVSKVKKPLFDIDYSDFFNIKENLEFVY